MELLILTLFWGLGFPLHKPYPYSFLGFSDSSILSTNEIFGEVLLNGPLASRLLRINSRRKCGLNLPPCEIKPDFSALLREQLWLILPYYGLILSWGVPYIGGPG